MITKEDFSIDALVQKLKKPAIGTIVTFLGVVRGEGEIEGMNVEVYKEMGEEELEKLEK